MPLLPKKVEIRLRETGELMDVDSFRLLRDNVSFPNTLTPEDVDPFGADLVLAVEQPEITSCQSVERDGVELNDENQWVAKWVVRDWTQQEVAANLCKLKAEKHAVVYAECDRRIWKMVENYSSAEQMTFSRQNAEAFAYTSNSAAPTPIIDAILSTNTSVTKPQLISRILEKANSFSEYSGKVVGYRQALTLRIINATAANIQDIDPLVGWP